MSYFQPEPRGSTWLINRWAAAVGEPRTRIGMVWQVTSAGRLEARWVDQRRGRPAPG